MKDLLSEIKKLTLTINDDDSHEDKIFDMGYNQGIRNCLSVIKHINVEEVSDGYHTFHSLYDQRMYLFATIVQQNKDKAWKSRKHEDGELCFGGGWFIVGVDTPQGSYTYHYIDKYWDIFDCQELEVAKHWDGHTDEDVTRLLAMESKVQKLNNKIEKQSELLDEYEQALDVLRAVLKGPINLELKFVDGYYCLDVFDNTVEPKRLLATLPMTNEKCNLLAGLYNNKNNL